MLTSPELTIFEGGGGSHYIVTDGQNAYEVFILGWHVKLTQDLFSFDERLLTRLWLALLVDRGVSVNILGLRSVNCVNTPSI